MAISDLKEINVAGDDGAFEAEIESLCSVILDIAFGQKHRYFDSDGSGVIDEHETQQCFMPPPIVERSRES